MPRRRFKTLTKVWPGKGSSLSSQCHWNTTKGGSRKHRCWLLLCGLSFLFPAHTHTLPTQYWLYYSNPSAKQLLRFLCRYNLHSPRKKDKIFLRFSSTSSILSDPGPQKDALLSGGLLASARIPKRMGRKQLDSVSNFLLTAETEPRIKKEPVLTHFLCPSTCPLTHLRMNESMHNPDVSGLPIVPRRDCLSSPHSFQNWNLLFFPSPTPQAEFPSGEADGKPSARTSF